MRVLREREELKFEGTAFTRRWCVLNSCHGIEHAMNTNMEEERNARERASELQILNFFYFIFLAIFK